MQDHKIDTFLKVCEVKNFTYAAQALGLTQPAVSRQMQALEEHYGCMLFYYQGKKLCLTKQGEQLYAYASAQRNDEQRFLRLLQKQQPHVIKIGATPTPGSVFVPKAIAFWHKEDPMMQIQLSIHNTKTILKQVKAGQYDFAIVEGSFPKTQFAYQTLMQQRYQVVCASFKKIQANTIQDLCEETIVVREEGSSNRRLLEDTLAQQGMSIDDFASVIETNSLQAQKVLLTSGCGFSLLFEQAIMQELQQKQLTILPVAHLPIEKEVCMVWQKDGIFQNERALLAQCFASYYQKITV